MAQTETNTSPERNLTKLYNALIKRDEAQVIKLCQQIKEGPLHILTVHNDTVLHVATYCSQKSLIIKLLDCLSSSNWSNLVYQNKMGNTVLHEAASLHGLASAAKEMLSKCPELLSVRNSCGETALFQAARYGAIDMYNFLDGEVRNMKKDYKDFHRRNDKTNILHVSILAEHFDLALLIVSNPDYKYLARGKDDAGRTALQLLACNSSAFLSGSKISFVKKTFYQRDSTQANDARGEVKSCCRVPLLEGIQLEKRRYVSAFELAKILIEEETCWDKIELGTDGDIPTSVSLISRMKDPENPLILATKSGCTEIVKEILDKYPHAVEHVDHEYNNILQVAIKYRRIEIFDHVTKKMVVSTKRLIRKIDNKGNSLLHLVGIREYHADEAADMRSPVLRLQEILLLFERVKQISTPHFIKRENSKGQTAEILLEESTAQLRNEAKEWTTRTAANCSIVSVLIATVAFAAIYTVPGGPHEETGYPILQNEAFFVTFTVADVLSLGLALSSVITFLSILTSSFRLRDFKLHLPRKLMMAVTFLVLSISMMMLAFAATIILMIECSGRTKIGLCVIVFLPVAIFVISYFPLYASLAKSFIYSLKKIGPALPRCSTDHC